MWIFGYGSLIWKPGFDWVERQVGFVRGWQRRFYQGSFDHRGVPGRPGRVVTLLPHRDSWTWGVAFRVEGEAARHILLELDHREKGGYQRHHLPIYAGDPQGHHHPVVHQALIYVATEENSHYLGPATPQQIASQALDAVGPSGPNAEYILELAASLRHLDVEDPHVFEVAEELRRLL